MMDVDVAMQIARESYAAGYVGLPGEEQVREIVWRNLVIQKKGDVSCYDHPLRHVVLEMEDCE